jgi:hypothetical protein
MIFQVCHNGKNTTNIRTVLLRRGGFGSFRGAGGRKRAIVGLNSHTNYAQKPASTTVFDLRQQLDGFSISTAKLRILVASESGGPLGRRLELATKKLAALEQLAMDVAEIIRGI